MHILSGKSEYTDRSTRRERERRVFFFTISSVFNSENRLISVVDVVGPMNPYQPIPFHILSFAVFQSRILIYAGSTSIAEEKSI